MRQLKICLLGCLPGFLLLAVAGSSFGGSAPSRDDAGARAACLEAYKVLMHPRCVNCHPAGDAPLQGEDSRPHTFFRLRRGADGHGVLRVGFTENTSWHGVVPESFHQFRQRQPDAELQLNPYLFGEFRVFHL